MSKQLSSFQPQLKSLLDGLVGYWKLDESSGNASDSSGNGYTLTNTGITYSTGKINNGAVYDTSTDKFNGGNILSFTGDFTYSMWIKSSSTTTGQLMYKSAGGNVYALTYNPTGNDGLLQMNVYYSATDHYSRSSGTSLNDNNWHHIVAVINDTNDTISLYKDGFEVSYTTKHTSAFTTPANTGNQYIGNNGSDTSTFIGTIDEIASWNRALTPVEIKALYNSGNAMAYPLGSTPNSTKLYMPLNGNSVDISGNGNHGVDTSISYVQGKFGQGARFNGSSSKIVTSTSSYISSYTYSFWLYRNSGGTYYGLISKDDGSTRLFSLLSNTSGQIEGTAWLTTGSQSITAFTIKNNVWNNIVITLNSGVSLKAYLNGLEVFTAPISFGANTTSFGTWFGADQFSGGRWFLDGIMDEIIHESRAWTSQEISLYYRKSMLNYQNTRNRFMAMLGIAYNTTINTVAFTSTVNSLNVTKSFIRSITTTAYTFTLNNIVFGRIMSFAINTLTYLVTLLPENIRTNTWRNPDNKSSTTYTNPDNKSSTTWTNTNKNS